MPQTQNKNPKHTYLEFLIPLTPSMVKIMNLLQFQIYKPTNINHGIDRHYLVNMDHKGGGQRGS
jgi:hypothetical protein